MLVRTWPGTMRGYFNDRMLDAFCLPVHKKCCTSEEPSRVSGPCFAEFPNVCVAVGVRVDVFALLDIG